MSKIQRIIAREVLDSRGQPTVEVEVHCQGGAWGTAIVPSGASTGAAEALELRDGDPGRYDGKGVRKAVENVHRHLAPAVTGLDATDQSELDRRLMVEDGTPNKSRLGANAILGVSLAAAHAAAAAKGVPLFRHFHELLLSTAADSTSRGAESLAAPRMPLPMVNMISGGLHAGGNLEFQDFLIEPVGAASYSQGLEWVVRVYRRLGELLTQAGYEGRLVGDEGGYGPRLQSPREACEFIVRAIEAARLRPGEDVTISLDVASTHFFEDGRYRLRTRGDRRLSPDELIDELESLVRDFPVRSIEDGLAEDDWSGWKRLTERLQGRVQLVGDDFFATNPERLQRGISAGVATSVLVKVNQVGTVSETLHTVRLAASAGYVRVVSARSGETEDSTIADLAVGVAAEKIKIGCIVRSERLAKYNRLLRIEQLLTA